MNILVSFKVKWGKELFYPENEDAVFLTEFTGRPTLLIHQLNMARNRGWNVEVIHKKFDLDEYLKAKMPKKRISNMTNEHVKLVAKIQHFYEVMLTRLQVMEELSLVAVDIDETDFSREKTVEINFLACEYEKIFDTFLYKESEEVE